jgi:hypothetical protein
MRCCTATPPAQRGNPVDRAIGDRFGVVEKPVQSLQRDFAVDLLENVERAAEDLVIGGVKPPWPAIFGQDAHDLLKFTLHLWRHVRTGLAEILEVGGGKDQHLATAIVPEIVIALLVLGRLRPVEEILLLALWLVGEEVVGQPDRELPVFGELLNDTIVFRVVLKTAARGDGAGHAEAVELAHEMARRIDLIVERQLRTLGQRRIKDAGIGLGDQQAGRIAVGVTHDLASRRIRRLLRISDRP